MSESRPGSSHPLLASGPILNVGEQLVSIMDQIAASLDAERATLFLYDRETHELWSGVVTGGNIAEIRIKADTGVAGWVMTHQRILNIPDAYADERFNAEVDRQSGFRTRNILCCPIFDLADTCIGVVQVLNKRSGAFDEADERLLQASGNQSATAIENAQLYEHVAALRETERELTEKLEAQHRQLQDAYVEIEKSTAALEEKLGARLWTRRLSIGLVVLVFGMVLVYSLQSFDSSSTGPESNGTFSTGYEVLEVQARPVSEYLQLKGAVLPAQWIEISSPVDTTVTTVDVSYGDSVLPGQALAALDVAGLDQTFRDAQSAYITALEQAEALDNWADSPEVSRARRLVSAAERSVAEAERELDETRRLFEIGIVARGELDAAQSRVLNAERGLADARDELESAQRQGNERQREIARLKLENARQSLGDVQSAIDAATLRSPVAGIVYPGGSNAGEDSAQNSLRPGLTVAKNDALFAIADMQGIRIEAEVPESNILEVEQGQPADVRIDAMNNVPLAGRISFIASRAATTGDSGSRGSSFAVTVTVTDVPESVRRKLRLGMSAVARVRVFFDPAGIVIPFDALVLRGNERLVRIGNTPPGELRSVSTGASLPDGIHITEGVSPGESILIIRETFDGNR